MTHIPEATPLELDGREGGGQLLRTALALSLLTGRSFRVSGFREGRSPSGLRAPHLACFRGAEAISEGRGEGADVGATQFGFRPGPVRKGRYLLELGTDSSAPRLLQSLFYPLSLAGGGELTLRGCTHLRGSPSFHDLSWAWLPALQIYGFRAELSLRCAGFAPEAGGEMHAEIAAHREPPNVVELLSRGALRDVHATAMAGGLPFDAAQVAARSASQSLREHGVLAEAEKRLLPVSGSSGIAVFVRAEFERSIASFTSVGDRNSAPDAVGAEAARMLGDFLGSGGAIEAQQAEQLLFPAALLAAGLLGPSEKGLTRFHSAAVTPSLRVTVEVLQRFLPTVRFRLDAEGGVEVGPLQADTATS